MAAPTALPTWWYRACLVLAAILGAEFASPSRAGTGGGGALVLHGRPDKELYFGVAVTGAGDSNKDGIPDVVVTAERSDASTSRILMVSGADGAILWTREGETGSDGFGTALAEIGDLDGRGSPDILVGAPYGQTTVPEDSWRTYAKVFAGEDGALLFNSPDMPSFSHFGAAVAGLGDLNADGVPDFAVGRREFFGSSAPGSVHVYSGIDGSLLKTLVGPQVEDGFGATLAGLGDVDGDGVRDFVVGSPWFDRGRILDAGRIAVYSGATFEEIRSLEGRRKGQYLGWSLAALTAPGSPVDLIAVVSPPGARGAVGILDGRTLRTRRILRPGPRVGFGYGLAGVGDVDADGIPDVGVYSSSVGDAENHDGAGLVEVFSVGTGAPLFAVRLGPQTFYIHSFASVGIDSGEGPRCLVVGDANRDEVAVIPIVARPTRGTVRVSLQRPAGEPLSAVRGSLEFGPLSVSRPMSIAIHGFEPTELTNLSAFLETSPVSGVFVHLGGLYQDFSAPGDWYYYGDPASWEFPEEFRHAPLEDFVGCRVEVRNSLGAVLLHAVVPDAGAGEFAAASPLAPPGPGTPSRAAGRVRVASSARDGTVRIVLTTRSLPSGTTPVVWIEDGPSTGEFAPAGPLLGGRLVLDSERGDALPSCAPDGPSLSGRLVEVRDGADVLLRGTLP